MKHRTRPPLLVAALGAILGAVASWSVSRGIAPLWVVASALFAGGIGLLIAASRDDGYRLACTAPPIAVVLSWYLQPDHPAWFPLWTLLPVLAWAVPRIIDLPDKWRIPVVFLPYLFLLIAWFAGGMPVWCLVALLAIPATLRDDSGLEPALVGMILFTIGYLITGIAR